MKKCSSRALVQLPVFQETIFKGETLLLALAPFLKVEINVGALKKKVKKLRKSSSSNVVLNPLPDLFIVNAYFPNVI